MNNVGHDIGQVVLADETGALFALPARLLQAPTAVTVEQVEAARLTDEAHAAVHMALSYERVGQVCGPAVSGTDEVVLDGRRFTVLGAIGSM